MADKPYESVAKTTPNITAEQIEKLKELFPECVSEGKVEFDRLRATLGESDVLAGEDGYSFTWAGKAATFQAIQTPSAATLKPVPDESVNFDETKHIFIEGENLEVLKLLYKSYFGKVKLIYIDPPYNTGNEFIYQDDYSEPRRAYLEKTGQMDAEGNILRSNPEARGRHHSAWLSMMYPRLFVARQLLRENGVLLVSIDENEVHHLRLVLNEVFGEENFITSVIWFKVFGPKNTARHFSEDHDYILVYAKNADEWRPNLLPRSEEADSRYSNPDDDPRGPWASSDLTARNYYGEGKYEVTSPSGKTFTPSMGTYWRVSYEKFQELQQDNRIWWGEDGNNMPRLKRFLSEVQQGIVPRTIWHYEDVGHTQEAKKELLAHVNYRNTENVLNTVKPTRLIQRILRLGTDPQGSDLVMDFFAGSAVTAQAVLHQNREDDGNRRSILVQLPEPLPIEEDDLKTISDVGKERLRSVIKQLGDSVDGQLSLENQGSKEDLGFKCFRLAKSDYRHFEPPSAAESEVGPEQLAFFEGGLEPGAEIQDVVYEVLLKEGYRLNSTIHELDLDTTDNQIFRVTDELPDAEAGDASRYFYICLDETVQVDTLDALDLNDDITFVCLDSALDDSLKLNLAEQCRLKVI